MIKPYWWQVILCLVLASITVAATLYVPIVTGDGIDYMIGEGKVDFTKLSQIVILLGIVTAVSAFAQWLMSMVTNHITYQVVRDIRIQAFNHMEKLPIKYIDSHQPGETLSLITTDVDQFSDGLLMGFTQVFSGVMTILGTLGFMFYINIGIACLVVLLTPISFFVANFIARRTYSMFKLQSETRAEMTSLVEEMVGNHQF